MKCICEVRIIVNLLSFTHAASVCLDLIIVHEMLVCVLSFIFCPHLQFVAYLLFVLSNTYFGDVAWYILNRTENWVEVT